MQRIGWLGNKNQLNFRRIDYDLVPAIFNNELSMAVVDFNIAKQRARSFSTVTVGGF